MLDIEYSVSEAPMPPATQLRVCVLASGSSGNCIHVESPTTALLIDAGLSARETLRRMAAAGLDPAKLRAICISHEHADHIAGLLQLHKRLGLGLYANRDTALAIRNAQDLPWNLFSSGSRFAIGDIEILPFPLPHDAYDPVGFVLTCGTSRLGVATDLGIPTQVTRERLRGCQLLVLEANHDETLLQNSFRPWALKKRIRGRQGHLSNETAAMLLTEIAGETLQQVFLAHLSRECNTLELAMQIVRNRLAAAGLDRIRVLPTHPDRPSEFGEC
jgi:phosphoribosyl 1,2-cyclic phosphodiesterase